MFNEETGMFSVGGVEASEMEDVGRIYQEAWWYIEGANDYPLDREKGLELLQKTAALGYSEAMNTLGFFYENGKIVPQNHEKAVQWYLKAVKADKENMGALFNMGRMLAQGLGIKKDLGKAFVFFSKVIEDTTKVTKEVYGNSCWLMGDILIEHFQNEYKAYYCYMQAAAVINRPEIWHSLGVLSEKGFGENPSKRTAYDFYINAAEQGYMPAMDAAGRILCSVNMWAEGKKWLEQAARLGYEPSKKRLWLLRSQF